MIWEVCWALGVLRNEFSNFCMNICYMVKLRIIRSFYLCFFLQASVESHVGPTKR